VIPEILQNGGEGGTHPFFSTKSQPIKREPREQRASPNFILPQNPEKERMGQLAVVCSQ
jgi:hypothetical protein